MPHESDSNRRRAALKIVFIYLLFGLGWLYSSDEALHWLVHDRAILVRIAEAKGSFFIFCTAGLLYCLIEHFLGRAAAADRQRIDSANEREAIFNATNEVIFIHDGTTGRILDVNSRMLEIYGYNRAEVIGKDVSILSQDVELYSATQAALLIRKAMTDGPQVFEWPCRTKAGRSFPTEVSLRRLDGNRDRVIAVVRDISERKQAETATLQAEQRFRSLVECSTDVIFVLDQNGNFRFASPAWEKHFGYPVSQVIGQSFATLVHPDDVAACREHLGIVLAGGEGLSSQPYRVRHLDGSYRHFIANGTRYIDTDGALTYLGVARDITAQLKADEESHMLERQMINNQRLESLGILAGGIAHDFNNILTAIIGNVSYARTTVDRAAPAFEPLQRAEKAAGRAAGLARRLLAFAKGGEPLKKPISLRQVINESAELILSGSNVQGKVELPPDLQIVDADEGQLGQALNNLFINAVQSMPDGGQLTITAANIELPAHNTQGLRPGSYVQLLIADSGCGIAEKDLGRIFDPYFSKKSGGTGLGLSSTYAVIGRHGGHISVTSVLDQGTTFIILLPGYGAEHRDHDAVNGQPLTECHGNCSILVMDDDEMVRELATITLQRLGYSVTCCHSGADTVAAYRDSCLKNEPFDLVIMDLTIPGGMGGVEAASQILAFNPSACLVVSSGYSEDPVMANYASYGFCAALEKPYNVELVAGLLHKLRLKMAQAEERSLRAITPVLRFPTGREHGNK